jgi:hypothetical protein
MSQVFVGRRLDMATLFWLGLAHQKVAERQQKKNPADKKATLII